MRRERAEQGLTLCLSLSALARVPVRARRQWDDTHAPGYMTDPLLQHGQFPEEAAMLAAATAAQFQHDMEKQVCRTLGKGWGKHSRQHALFVARLTALHLRKRRESGMGARVRSGAWASGAHSDCPGGKKGGPPHHKASIRQLAFPSGSRPLARPSRAPCQLSHPLFHPRLAQLHTLPLPSSSRV